MNTPNVLHLLVILFYGFMSTNSSSGASKIRQLNALLRSNFSPSIKPNDGEKSVRLEDKMWPQLKPDVVYYGPSIAAEGTQVSLSCRVLVYASVTWTINDRRVDDEDARITINEQIDKRVNRISSLRIVNASISDSGDYRCNTFSPLSHRLDIAPTRVSWASSNLDQSPRSSYVLKEGHRFTLPCEFEEEPEGQIRWFKNGVQVQYDGRVNIAQGSLVFEPVLRTDAGQYSCHYENGQIKSGPDITLRARALVEPFKGLVHIQQYGDLKLECKVSGYPLPLISWFIDGVQIVNQDTGDDDGAEFEFATSGDGYPNAILVQRNLSSVEQSSKYTCRAENVISSDESSLYVAVTSGKVVTNVEPGRGGIELLASKKVLVLQCNHTGSTDATPTWLKDGEDVSALEESLRDRIQTFPANRSLVITKLLNSVKRLETKLEGIYTCRFEDGETGEINVRSRPDIVINEGDSASKIDKSLNVVEGEGISLTCKVPPTNKDEGLKLSWLIGEDLDSLRPYSSDVSNENNTVGITRLVIAAADYEDRAYYVCRADNGVTAPVDYSVLVRVKDKLAALWPFLGIVGEVLILCTVIFIYEKRRDKPDFEESDTDNTENKSPQSTSKGQEIRQRK